MSNLLEIIEFQAECKKLVLNDSNLASNSGFILL